MKQIIILFEENLSKGFSRTRQKRISLYIDIPSQCLRLDDLSNENNCFIRRCHPGFALLQQLLEQWRRNGIEATVYRHFDHVGQYYQWRKTAMFQDYEVHWQVLIENSDTSWDLYLEFDLVFPQKLEEIYRVAKKLR